jgi:hypothetical protein
LGNDTVDLLTIELEDSGLVDFNDGDDEVIGGSDDLGFAMSPQRRDDEMKSPATVEAEDVEQRMDRVEDKPIRPVKLSADVRATATRQRALEQTPGEMEGFDSSVATLLPDTLPSLAAGVKHVNKTGGEIASEARAKALKQTAGETNDFDVSTPMKADQVPFAPTFLILCRLCLSCPHPCPSICCSFLLCLPSYLPGKIARVRR